MNPEEEAQEISRTLSEETTEQERSNRFFRWLPFVLSCQWVALTAVIVIQLLTPVHYASKEWVRRNYPPKEIRERDDALNAEIKENRRFVEARLLAIEEENARTQRDVVMLLKAILDATREKKD